jgi:anaerobic selenocysteine-containing dehydrogenase/GMP synthase-like glutamine amidotransferase
MASRKIRTSCTRDCPNTCGLIATVEDGRLVKLGGNPDHPLTRGVACHKTSKYVARVYSPERVTFPMIRRHGQWQRASWNEVLDLIAERMKTFAAESGTESILYYQGYGERTALKLLNKYFFNLFGGVTTMRGSLCGGAGQGSQNLDFGERISHDPLDHLNSNSMVLWARNPVSTNISLVPIARDVKKRGGTVIVIDPAHTRSVMLADHHIAPRPGGDGYLAMAATKLILQAGAEDRTFLEQHAVGFPAYQRILDRYTVEDLCAKAGVPVSDAEMLAHTLLHQKPTSILLGWGLHRYEYAHHVLRPIDALGAVSGNIGVPGGGVSQGFEEYGPYVQSYWGDGLHAPRRTLLIPKVGEEILCAQNPKIRMIYVTAANPVCMAPNTAKIAKAFDQAEFVVYSGHFMDDTADHADVFLPATTFLEEDDIVASYGHNFVGAVNKAIAPVGECKSEFDMFFDLASRFPFAEQYRKPVDEWLQLLCAPIWEQGGTLKRVREKAFRLDAPMVPYADKTFRTASGKFQFMTEFDDSGHPGSDPAYPYKLLTIAPHDAICSELTMAEHAALPAVRLNAGEAARLGLQPDRPVMVQSAFGAIKAVLQVEDGLRPDVLVAERGGWAKAGHGLNLLTRDMASLVGQGTPFYETTVAVTPCPEGGALGVRLLVIQLSDHAPGGNFCKSLQREGAVLHILRPDEGEVLPETPEGYGGLVVLGGPQHAFDDAGSPFFPHLLHLMRAFDAGKQPVAGICLGGQLLARAHGAAVWSMHALEYGFVQHRATPEGQVDPVLGPSLPLPRVMEFHEDSFDLPEHALLLVEGAACANQCFRVGNASYGFQFHLEVDSVIASQWVELFRKRDVENYAAYRERYSDAFLEELAGDLALLTARSEVFCRRVALNWLKLCAPQVSAAA